jgi:hypothetical protein
MYMLLSGFPYKRTAGINAIKINNPYTDNTWPNYMDQSPFLRRVTVKNFLNSYRTRRFLNEITKACKCVLDRDANLARPGELSR